MSRTKYPLLRPALLLAALLAVVASARPQDDKKDTKAKPGEAAKGACSLLFSDSASEYKKTEAVLVSKLEPVTVWLRPNTEVKFYLFVRNASEDDKAVRLQLQVPGPAGADVTVATWDKAKTPKGNTPVAFARPPAPAPTDAPKKPDAAAASAPAGIESKGLPPQFRLILSEGEDLNSLKIVQRVPVAVMQPSWYVVDAKANYDLEGPTLSATLTASAEVDQRRLFGPAAPVLMSVLTAAPQDVAAEPVVTPVAALERSLKPGAKGVRVTAQGETLANLPGGRAYATLAVDGYDRAFTFPANLKAESGQDAIPSTADAKDAKPVLYLRVPTAQPAGSKVPVRLGLDDLNPTLPQEADKSGTTLEVEFVTRPRRGSGETIESRKLDGARSHRVVADPFAAGGAFVLRAEVSDWTFELPTPGLVGEMLLRVRAIDAAGKPIVLQNSKKPEDPWVEREIVLDNTAPDITDIDVAKEYRGKSGKPRLKAGAPLKVFAVGRDPRPVSGIDKVYFFLGKPTPDPKNPRDFVVPDDATEGTLEGKYTADGDNTYVAQLDKAATDKPGAVDVTAAFVNKAGLKYFKIIRVELEAPEPATPDKDGKKPEDKPKEAKTTGVARGYVREDGRPQANLAVQLVDGDNKVKGTATTEADGQFAFKDVPAGSYRVFVRKRAKEAQAPVEVKAGVDKPPRVLLDLKTR